MGTIVKSVALLCFGILLWGCSSGNSGSPAFDSVTGKHPANWIEQHWVAFRNNQEQCIACHGSTDKDFTAKPGPAACRGCHADQVAQARKSKGKEGKNCFPCHDPHALTVKSGMAKPYHAQGGR